MNTLISTYPQHVAMDAAPAQEVVILRTPDAIESVREAWQALAWHPNADIDSYFFVMEKLGSSASPYVVIARDGGVIRALLVGRCEDDRLKLRLGYWTLGGPKCTTITFVYGGVLGNPTREQSEALVSAILCDLRRGRADMAYFNHLRVDSPLYIAATMRPPACSRDYCSTTQSHQHLTLLPSREEFLKSLPTKARRNLQWQARRFEKVFPGKLRISSLGDREDLPTLVHDVEEIAAGTYQRGLCAGFQDTPESRQRLTLHAQNGWLRAYILYVDDRPAAFWMGLAYERTFHSEYMGYKQDYAQYSPGMYLIVEVIEGLCADTNGRSIDAIDFGLGDAQYKRLLSDESWTEATPFIFAPTLRGVLLNLLRTPILHLDRLCRRVLGSQLEARVKRIWRRRVASRLHGEAGEASSQKRPNQ